MAVHVEIIGLQKDPVRRALKHVLLRIDKDLRGIKPLLVPMLTYPVDDYMTSLLK